MNKKFVSVILDNNIDKTLDYHVPEEFHDKIDTGMRIEVPVKGFPRKGYILNIKDKSDVKKTLPIRKILSEKVISKDLFSLALWMAKYYACWSCNIIGCTWLAIFWIKIKLILLLIYLLCITINEL